MKLSPHPASPDSSRRVPELDGIRGIAIFLVLLWHYAGFIIVPHTSGLGDFVARMTASAWSGVDLFFVLSGFLIGGILLDNRNAPHYFKAFYIRRISRIFPLYFSWLFLYIGITWGLPQFTSTALFANLVGNPMPLWTYLTFTQNFAMGLRLETGPAWLGITWSLAIEEQFYAILPLLVRLVPLKRLPLLLLASILLAPAFRLSVVALAESPFPAYVLLPGRADALLLGVMCAHIVRQEHLKNLLTRHTLWLYLALGVLFLGIVFLTAQSPSAASLEMVAWGYSLFAIFYTCCLLLAVTERRGIVTAITRNRLLRRLGILAYGVYMLHPTIIYFAHTMILHQVPQIRSVLDILVTLFAFALVLLIASASWSLFESKIVMLGHRAMYYDQMHAKLA